MSVDSGARVAEVTRIAEALNADIAVAEQIAGSAGTSIKVLTAVWRGADSQALQQDWQRVGQPAYAEASQRLRDMVTQLRQQMAAQSSTSGDAPAGPQGWGGPDHSRNESNKDHGEGEESESPLETLRGLNDAFVSLWTLALADLGIERIVGALKSAGLLDALPGLLGEQASIASRLQALEVLKGMTGLDPASAGEMDALARQLSVVESAIPGAADAERLAGVLRGASRAAGGLALIGDVLTVVDPPHDGVRGGMEQGAAAVNGALTVAVLAGAEIPVVGEVVLIGTGLYLAGDWLYDNWQPFHDVCDDIGHGAEQAWNATTDAISDAAGEVADVASDVAGDIGDAAGDAWDTVTGWF